MEKASLRYDLTDIARIAFMFNGGQSPASILSPICTKNCTAHLHYKGLWCAFFVFLKFWVFGGDKGLQGDPPPSLKYPWYSSIKEHKWKIRKCTSLDILLKISHTNFRTNQIINRGRKLPDIFEYSGLFLQLRKWNKLFNSLDIDKSLRLIHSNRINHETYPEPCFPSPQLYLLSHTLRWWALINRTIFRLFLPNPTVLFERPKHPLNVHVFLTSQIYRKSYMITGTNHSNIQ